MPADRHARLADTRLYLVATVPRMAEGGEPPHWWWSAVESAVRGGAGAVQLRAKDASTAQRIRLGRAARELLGDRCLLLVNDDLEAALDDAFDGLHLGREDAARLWTSGRGAGDWSPEDLKQRLSELLQEAARMARREREELHRRAVRAPSPKPGPDDPDSATSHGLSYARTRLGYDRLLGSSTRNRRELEAALHAGVDHVGFGAMAPTRTKRDSQPADPLELARCARMFAGHPVFPIGGLGPSTLAPVLDAGVGRAAVGSAVLDAADPWAVAAELVRMLATARPPRRLPPEESGSHSEGG